MVRLLLLTALPGAAPSAPGDSAALFMDRGVSHALAEHRARTFAGVRYTLTLDVSALDSAVGRVVVRFRRSGRGDAILDFRGRRLLGATANGAAISPDAFNGAHLRIAESCSGPARTPSTSASCRRSRRAAPA